MEIDAKEVNVTILNWLVIYCYDVRCEYKMK